VLGQAEGLVRYAGGGGGWGRGGSRAACWAKAGGGVCGQAGRGGGSMKIG
jgi:hypothetical protein